MTRVKICGITRAEDAVCAMDYGADAIGMVFASGRRQVTPEAAQAIVKAVGPWMSVIGVFVNASHEEIEKAVKNYGLTGVQLHGDETPEFASKLRHVKRIKAFRVGGQMVAKDINDFPVDAVLFDAKIGNSYGGTGVQFDWNFVPWKAIRGHVILAGGINSENVERAIRKIHPYGVDVSSGVESAPGVKDYRKIREFLKRIK